MLTRRADVSIYPTWKKKRETWTQTQPATVVCKMEAQLEFIPTHCIHVFGRLAPDLYAQSVIINKIVGWEEDLACGFPKVFSSHAIFETISVFFCFHHKKKERKKKIESITIRDNFSLYPQNNSPHFCGGLEKLIFFLLLFLPFSHPLSELCHKQEEEGRKKKKKWFDTFVPSPPCPPQWSQEEKKNKGKLVWQKKEQKWTLESSFSLFCFSLSLRRRRRRKKRRRKKTVFSLATSGFPKTKGGFLKGGREGVGGAGKKSVDKKQCRRRSAELDTKMVGFFFYFSFFFFSFLWNCCACNSLPPFFFFGLKKKQRKPWPFNRRHKLTIFIHFWITLVYKKKM